MEIAICDDELEQLDIIEKLLTKLDEEHQFHIYRFSSGEDLVNACEEYIKFTIIFLDMKLNGMDGISAAKKIREHDSNCIIIIISSIVEYAVRGYGINAFDFILKPIDVERFNSIMKHAVNHIKMKNNILYIIENRNRKEIIKLSDIIYIESRGRNIEIICKDNTFTKNNSISLEEKELYDKGFIRISRYYIVNLRHVKEIRNETMILSNQINLNISPKLHSKVYDRFIDFMMENI